MWLIIQNSRWLLKPLSWRLSMETSRNSNILILLAFSRLGFERIVDWRESHSRVVALRNPPEVPVLWDSRSIWRIELPSGKSQDDFLLLPGSPCHCGGYRQTSAHKQVTLAKVPLLLRCWVWKHVTPWSRDVNGARLCEALSIFIGNWVRAEWGDIWIYSLCFHILSPSFPERDRSDLWADVLRLLRG